jgi:hypothetical protein
VFSLPQVSPRKHSALPLFPTGAKFPAHLILLVFDTVVTFDEEYKQSRRLSELLDGPSIPCVTDTSKNLLLTAMSVK